MNVANVQNVLYIIFEKNAFFYVLFNIIISELLYLSSFFHTFFRS